MNWNKSTSKGLVDKTLENSFLSVFQKLDKEGRGTLDFDQFEQFLRYNCLDFVLDFFDKQYLQLHLFNQEG